VSFQQPGCFEQQINIIVSQIFAKPACHTNHCPEYEINIHFRYLSQNIFLHSEKHFAVAAHAADETCEACLNHTSNATFQQSLAGVAHFCSNQIIRVHRCGDFTNIQFDITAVYPATLLTEPIFSAGIFQ